MNEDLEVRIRESVYRTLVDTASGMAEENARLRDENRMLKVSIDNLSGVRDELENLAHERSNRLAEMGRLLESIHALAMNSNESIAEMALLPERIERMVRAWEEGLS